MATSLARFLDLPKPMREALGCLHTPAEIAQQPDTWKSTLADFERLQAGVRAFLEEVGVRTDGELRPAVTLIGAGSSDYAAQAVEFVLRQQWGCQVSALASTEMLPNLEEYAAVGRRSLWISFSRSGDSPEGVAVLEQALARYPEIAHLVVTCNAAGRMAAVCQGVPRAYVVVLDDAVNDRSLVMTSSFTNMIVLGHCLAHAWSLGEYRPLLGRLAGAGEDLLRRAAALAEAMARRSFPRVCFVGSGALASVARESALKVLEMTAGEVKTMAETVLGLRHGPMAALDRQTLFICFVSAEQRRAAYARDLLREIGDKKIVAERIAVGPASAEGEFADACEWYLPLHGEIGDVYRPVLDVLFGQLLGLFFSEAHGLRPDAPSPDGVINRVVQRFQIY
jgi:tagatose-6-phosphate ketose/aldose isomerase